jgi:hypothetical protein
MTALNQERQTQCKYPLDSSIISSARDWAKIIFQTKIRHESKQHLVAQFEKPGLDKHGFALRSLDILIFPFASLRDLPADNYFYLLEKFVLFFVDSHSHIRRHVFFSMWLQN